MIAATFSTGKPKIPEDIAGMATLSHPDLLAFSRI
jgi:hypothetical protein